jgi:hypothetical protein
VDLGDDSLRPIPKKDWETSDLLAVRAERTVGEYCWTVTPFTPRIVFDRNPEVARVTYIDADLWFRASPALIFEEFESSGKSVLITEHAYDPHTDASATAGKYCVQFMTFTRNASDPVIDWWSKQCLVWCFNRYEDGKFGDQKYLDDWTQRFTEYVHVLGQKSLIQGPWNSQRFPYSEAVVFHFHGLRLVRGDRVYFGNYRLTTPLIDNVYIPYMAELLVAVERLSMKSAERKVSWRELLWFVRRGRQQTQNFWRTRPLRKLPRKI